MPEKTSEGSLGGGHDAAIQRPEDDLLGGKTTARSMHRMIRAAPAQWSTRLGLYGSWGSGKTSILNLLRLLEEEDGSIVLGFSAWSANSENEVLATFYSLLKARLKAEGITFSLKHQAKSAVTKAKKFSWFSRFAKDAIEDYVPVPPVMKKIATHAVSELTDLTFSWARADQRDIADLRRSLGERRVVVFIDDLDRADPRILPKTFLALKEILDWPGFVFVLAFDKRVVSKSLSEYSAAFGEDVQGFLEKIVDVPFEVPTPTELQKKRLAEVAFKACCEFMPMSSLNAISHLFPDQPRKIKLFARMFGALRPALARHDVEEVDWYALSLYLMLLESSRKLAEWVVVTAQNRDRDWMLWASDKEERKKNEDIAREVMRKLLHDPVPPYDIERVIEIGVLLLGKWESTSDAEIKCWTNLSSQEPGFTRREFHLLLQEFSTSKDPYVIADALRKSQDAASFSESEAVHELASIAQSFYQAALSDMAESRTQFEWDVRRQDALVILGFLEYLWRDFKRENRLAVFTDGHLTVSILGVFEQWITWTRDEGARELRERECKLALDVASYCEMPELLFESTDPFWNEEWPGDAIALEVKREWRTKLRKLLAPKVNERLLNRFTEADGLILASRGKDSLSAWWIESKHSPLYTEPVFSSALISLFRDAGVGDDYTRTILGKNAFLYLRQILFQTRDASWGGVEDAREIHNRNPEIIPAAWSVVLEGRMPFRMFNSIHKLRNDLISCGVAATDLVCPAWMPEPVTPIVEMQARS